MNTNITQKTTKKYVRMRVHRNMRKRVMPKTGIFLGFGLALVMRFYAYSVCPVCTVFAGAGVGLARWLGIDDSISGLWIGAFTLSLGLWIINFLTQKNIVFYGRKILVLGLLYATLLLPLYWTHMFDAGYTNITILGMHKLLFGIVLGSILFGASVLVSNALKKHNNGLTYVPMQKIFISFGVLLIASLFLYVITTF